MKVLPSISSKQLMPLDVLCDNSTQLSYQYNIIKRENLTDSEQCPFQWHHVIAINQNSTIMITGLGNKIIVFNFRNAQLEQKQILTQHQKQVSALYFMKKTNQFISGSYDKTLIIWQADLFEKFKPVCLLAHSSMIVDILMNKTEDLMIIINVDYTVSLWQKQDTWQLFHSFKPNFNFIRALSLSQSQDYLAFGGQNEIIIYKQNSQYKWRKHQKIVVEANQIDIIFIGNKILSLQSLGSECFIIYELNYKMKSFSCSKQITIQERKMKRSIPKILEYNQQQSILICLFDNYVTLIKIEEQNFSVLQTIDFNGIHIKGKMTADAQYLITWDGKSNAFQIRKKLQQIQ